MSINVNRISELYSRIVDKMLNVNFWETLLLGAFKIILLVIMAKVIVRLGSLTIQHILSNQAVKLDARRTKTLTVLSTSILRYVVYFILGLSILEQLNFPIQTLLTGAGLLGVALGFGSRNLVQDVISGFFIIFEDQFGVGDEIQIDTYRGTVEEVGLRVTKIRVWTGEVYIIPNGKINAVINYSKNNSIAVIDVRVAYEENMDLVYTILHKILKETKEVNKSIVGDVKILGVQDLGVNEILVRITAECRPTEHVSVERELRRQIKDAFVETGIQIPYPKQISISEAANVEAAINNMQ